MTTRRAAFLLSLATFAYMAGFVALYLDRLYPVFREITRALGS